MRITTSGFPQTMAKLNELTSRVQKRLVERAARAALKPMVASAKKRVPKDTGNLRKSIGVKKAKRVGKGEVVLLVGARQGFKWARSGRNIENDPVRYANPVEFGHVLPGGKFIPPVAFLRGAYETGKVKCVADFAEELKKRVDAELARK